MEDRDVKTSEEQDVVENEELLEKIADLQDKLLRAIAETQNIQKRAEREISDASKFGIASFARNILLVRDNLQLALNNCSESEDNKSIIEGVRLTLSEMDKNLAKHGIKIIESLGKKFDPHLHQAMIEIHDEKNEPGIVVQVMQEGFMIYDRLLRPALVGVSK